MKALTLENMKFQIREMARQTDLGKTNENVRPFEVDKHGRAIICNEILNEWLNILNALNL
jgi:hypothetical protein